MTKLSPIFRFALVMLFPGRNMKMEITKFCMCPYERSSSLPVLVGQTIITLCEFYKGGWFKVRSVFFFVFFFPEQKENFTLV